MMIAMTISASGTTCKSVFFFFSSRRRHTRYWRDWSSDVCSSDLARPRDLPRISGGHGKAESRSAGVLLSQAVRRALAGWPSRSEERRVGKECRSRWLSYNYIKNTRKLRDGKYWVDRVC